MAEPTPQDEGAYRRAIAQHCCKCALINAADAKFCMLCGRDVRHRDFGGCRANAADEMLRGALAAARLAGWRQGMEEAAGIAHARAVEWFEHAARHNCEGKKAASAACSARGEVVTVVEVDIHAAAEKGPSR